MSDMTKEPMTDEQYANLKEVVIESLEKYANMGYDIDVIRFGKDGIFSGYKSLKKILINTISHGYIEWLFGWDGKQDFVCCHTVDGYHEFKDAALWINENLLCNIAKKIKMRLQ